MTLKLSCNTLLLCILILKPGEHTFSQANVLYNGTLKHREFVKAGDAHLERPNKIMKVPGILGCSTICSKNRTCSAFSVNKIHQGFLECKIAFGNFTWAPHPWSKLYYGMADQNWTPIVVFTLCKIYFQSMTVRTCKPLATYLKQTENFTSSVQTSICLLMHTRSAGTTKQLLQCLTHRRCFH